MTGFTTAQQQIIQQAVDRWEEIIVGDLPNVTYQGRVIDDLAIAFSSITIDGTGSVLGQARPQLIALTQVCPIADIVQLDTSDVTSMQNSGTLLSVLEHEIAHVLGFGVLWDSIGLLSGTRTSSPGLYRCECSRRIQRDFRYERHVDSRRGRRRFRHRVGALGGVGAGE